MIIAHALSCYSRIYLLAILSIFFISEGFGVVVFPGSDQVGNDRHVEEEPQHIRNSLWIFSCNGMLRRFNYIFFVGSLNFL